MKNGITYLLEKQIAFSKNIEICREVIFDLRYSDIANYTGLAESTMISYDTRAVSPYLSVAKKIADLYCTSVERLCGDEIYYDKTEVLTLQVAFIKRLGGIPIRLYQEKLLAEIDKHLSLTRYQVFEMLAESFRQMIADLHRFGKYVRIDKDEKIVQNFTKNFQNLHTCTKTTYRRLGKATDTSIGNLSRLEQDNEPMLSSVIKLADYYGVTITQLLSDTPAFDYENIAQEISLKTKIANKKVEVSDEKIKEQTGLRADILDKQQTLSLITDWLNKVDG